MSGELGEGHVREIGDVHEGVIEGGEDACYAEDQLSCFRVKIGLAIDVWLVWGGSSP